MLGKNSAYRDNYLDHHDGIAPKESFQRMLCVERRRTERSGKPFLLMFLHVSSVLQTDKKETMLQKLLAALSASTRETDMIGWYKKDSVLGLIFTEIGMAERNVILSRTEERVRTALRDHLKSEQANNIHISGYFFPEYRDGNGPLSSNRLMLYPDMADGIGSKKLSRLIKRMMDIGSSIVALVLLSPLLLLISVAIKLSSKGPILFRQGRVGEKGIRFTFLKFRTMNADNDSRLHEEYVKKLISGQLSCSKADGTQSHIYKIVDDPRVTRLGKFLRKTSLDELPQFWNVLKGELSLVGPRPPIPYEFASYDLWHRRRVMEVKPGITGLWQVNGRSRTRFDDMVRWDLKYAKEWSPWLDVKILLQTPRTVMSGDGAY